MKIVQINATYMIGSTGKIVNDLNQVIENHGGMGYVAFAYVRDKIDTKKQFCTNSVACVTLDNKSNILLSRLSGVMGYRHKHQTQRLVQWIKNISPDIIHLHNIHGDWVNIPVLMNYLASADIPIVWTLHDCWAFTGRCSHFELAKCDKWKNGCCNCTNKNVYPITYLFDFSKQMWKSKRELFTALKNVTIVTPSEWLKEYVQQSFLGKYPVRVINNGINIEKYIPSQKKESANANKKMILGVASSWSKLKGLDDFYALDRLIDHDNYHIVLIGLNSEQLQKLPSAITGIQRTNNEQELIDYYSTASVFVNPTYQDNYPTTNLEAMACGTPVVTYKTGGSPESIPFPEYVVEQGDIAGLLKATMDAANKKDSMVNRIRNYAVENFSREKKYQQYIELYTGILRDRG